MPLEGGSFEEAKRWQRDSAWQIFGQKRYQGRQEGRQKFPGANYQKNTEEGEYKKVVVKTRP